MAFSHTTGRYNVEATLMAWLNERLTTNKPPLVTGTAVLRMAVPEVPVNCPMWSAHFLGYDEAPTTYQGRGTSGATHGARQHGLLEVSAWVSRENVQWRAQLAQMIDAVTASVLGAMASGSAIIVKDFYTSSTTPADTAYRITLEDVEVRTPPTDPNPDIERKRILIGFTWVERR